MSRDYNVTYSPFVLSQLTQTLGEKIHLASCKLLSQSATGAAA